MKTAKNEVQSLLNKLPDDCAKKIFNTICMLLKKFARVLVGQGQMKKTLDVSCYHLRKTPQRI